MTERKVTLSISGLKKLGASNGLDALADIVKKDSGVQYLIVQVVPTEDTRVRGADLETTTLKVIGVEPMISAGFYDTAKALMSDAARQRARNSPAGEQQELPLDDDVPGAVAEDFRDL
jgi:hypothetical protein